jgi:hypothetical protein
VTPPPTPQQAFTIMDQNRDGFIDKNDLRDTFAALGTLFPPHCQSSPFPLSSLSKQRLSLDSH